MKTIIIAVKLMIVMTLVLGLLYTGAITTFGHLFFNNKANGSLLKKDGHVIGSSLLAQEFKSDRYFWPRPSAAKYETVPSGASNLGPTSADLKTEVEKRSQRLSKRFSSHRIPQELLFASASGLDPHISENDALEQVNAVVAARRLNETDKLKIMSLIKKNTEIIGLGILGGPYVNVLELNVDLDKSF